MAKAIRIYELAKELEMKNSELVRYLNDLGVSVKSHASTLDEETCGMVRELILKEREAQQKEGKAPKAEPAKETSSKSSHVLAAKKAKQAAAEANLKPRPPVVVIMGHVDHGKTTLLDNIRKTHVTDQEFGGITQHIGAYQVEIKGKKITFLDTPGHAAFTAMRARGAMVTDIAVLIVAADDGVMPQTLEAIHHAKAAKVPIIVAVNKIDKPNANPEKVKRELMEQGLVPEEWGGDTIMVDVSAKQGKGIDKILEMILLVAEMQELKADPTLNPEGTVIEALLDRGRGAVATVIVQQGTFKVGQSIVAGESSGKIKAMTDENRKKMSKAGPAAPVQIIGFDSVPNAGDKVTVVPDERTARQMAANRIETRKESTEEDLGHITLEDLYNQIQQGEIKELNVVVKGDVQGSVEAVCESLTELKNDEVRISIVHSGVGPIGESDILLASASNAIVIGFNVKADVQAKHAAQIERVDVRTYRVIYDLLNDMKDAMTGMLKPVFEEVLLGKVEVRATFKLPKGPAIAGSYVTEGKVIRNADARIFRGKEQIGTGKISSLKHLKDDVREVLEGFECGVIIDGYDDIQVGDTMEVFQVQEKSRI